MECLCNASHVLGDLPCFPLSLLSSCKQKTKKKREREREREEEKRLLHSAAYLLITTLMSDNWMCEQLWTKEDKKTNKKWMAKAIWFRRSPEQGLQELTLRGLLRQSDVFSDYFRALLLYQLLKERMRVLLLRLVEHCEQTWSRRRKGGGVRKKEKEKRRETETVESK